MKCAELTEALAVGAKRYFTGRPCVHGHIVDRMVSNRRCVECLYAYRRTPSGRRQYLTSAAKSRSKPERRLKVKARNAMRPSLVGDAKVKAGNARRYAANPAARIARSRDREQALSLQTPRFAETNSIAEIYRSARRVSQCIGVRFVVDHIIPLKHKLVTGLHVHTNLQVISNVANSRKRNKFEIAA